MTWNGVKTRSPGSTSPAGLASDPIRNSLGPDHPSTLTTRGNIAYWTGEVGQAAEALRLLRELLPDRQRVLGPDHPHMLITRSNIARWTGEVGQAAEALRLLRELLPDLERVLGPDHPTTLSTRHEMSFWTEQAEGDHG
jgi:Tetratricopeptide repeat